MGQQQAQQHGHQHDLDDGPEQAAHVHRHPDAAQQPGQRRGQQQRDQGGRRRHGHGKRHIAAGDEGQHVGGRPARGRAHQDHAHGQFRRQGEHMAQTEGQQRHAAELHHQAQPQVTGVPQHMAEVLPVQGHAHAQHDDAQHGGNMRRHPGKDPGLPQGQRREGDDDATHEAGQGDTEPAQNRQHAASSFADRMNHASWQSQGGKSSRSSGCGNRRASGRGCGTKAARALRPPGVCPCLRRVLEMWRKPG